MYLLHDCASYCVQGCTIAEQSQHTDMDEANAFYPGDTATLWLKVRPNAFNIYSWLTMKFIHVF